METGEQLAVIREAGFGMRDMHRPGLFFTTKTADGFCALQVFFGEEAEAIFKSADAYHADDLNGKTCYVERDGALIRFKRMSEL